MPNSCPAAQLPSPCCDIERRIGGKGCEHVREICRGAAVGEPANAQLAGLAEDAVAFLHFGDRASGPERQDVGVRLVRHLERADAHRPIPAIQFHHGAAGEARPVRGMSNAADSHSDQFMKSARGSWA